jgi:hypothetical protein
LVDWAAAESVWVLVLDWGSVLALAEGLVSGSALEWALEWALVLDSA